MSKAEPVCSEPKVFVGQLPIEATKEDVEAMFMTYGNVKKCNLITGPDGRSKGCAMVLYDKWAEAEAAVESQNGTTSFGGSRALVVKFADPPKRGDGPIVGVAPKKLFVGQVPKDLNEQMLRNMFAPYGDIVELHILNKGNGAGCAFVTYSRWAEAEAAIEAHDGKTKLDGTKGPFVVKFADAKVGDAKIGEKRSHNDLGNSPNKKAFAPGPSGLMNPYNSYPNSGISGYGDMTPMGMGMGGMGFGNLTPGMGMGPSGVGMGMGGLSTSGMGMGGMGMGPAMGMGGMGMGANMGMGPGMGMGNSFGMGNTGMSAGGVSKLGSGIKDENAKQWKLFIGQVPFEASEYDLWSIFSPIGDILELVILRTPQGKSKGCAFVTYANRMLAEKAIRQLDGRQALPNDPRKKIMVVKYANQSQS